MIGRYFNDLRKLTLHLGVLTSPHDEGIYQKFTDLRNYSCKKEKVDLENNPKVGDPRAII